MELRPARLRKGEIVAGLSGAALLVFLFALDWFSSPASEQVQSDLGAFVNGWNGLPILRWLIVITALTALALIFTQATRRAPAIPVTLSVFVSVLGALSTMALLLRMLTTAAALQVGVWLGLLACIGIAVGGFASMRQEDGWVPGPEHPIETVSLRRP